MKRSVGSPANYDALASSDYVRNVNDDLVVSEPATIVGNLEPNICHVLFETEDDARIDACFDEQQCPLEVFEHDSIAFHRYWVYCNYTSVLLVLDALPVPLTYFWLLSGKSFPLAMTFFSVSLINFALGLCGIYHAWIVRMIPDSKVPPHTAMNHLGIIHVQGPSGNWPGGEIFIPFRNVLEVKVFLIKPHPGVCVSQVDILTNVDEETPLVVSGLPKFVHEAEDPTKPRGKKTIKLRIKGLRDPHQFKKRVLSNASANLGTRVASTVNGLQSGEASFVSPGAMATTTTTTSPTEETLLDLRNELCRHNDLLESILDHERSRGES